VGVLRERSLVGRSRHAGLTTNRATRRVAAHPIALGDEEVAQLVDFLHALADPKFIDMRGQSHAPSRAVRRSRMSERRGETRTRRCASAATLFTDLQGFPGARGQAVLPTTAGPQERRAAASRDA